MLVVVSPVHTKCCLQLIIVARILTQSSSRRLAQILGRMMKCRLCGPRWAMCLRVHCVLVPCCDNCG